MSEYVMALVWGVIIVLSIFIEVQTDELVSIWFMPGAVVALVISLFDTEVWVQWTVFVVLSAILLILSKTVLKKKLMKNVGKEKTDTDLLIGKTAIVYEDINNIEAVGSVKVCGNIWSARMEEDTDIASVGEQVTIVAISGVKLICKK